jgi:hypothetical protein
MVILALSVGGVRLAFSPPGTELCPWMEEMNSSTNEHTTTFLIIIKNPPFYEARESSIGYYIAIGLNMSSGKKV